MAFGLSTCSDFVSPKIHVSTELSNQAIESSTDAHQVCAFDKEYKLATSLKEGLRPEAVKIPEVRGEFEVKVATTFDKFYNEFKSVDWVRSYLKLIEVAIAESTNELKCKAEDSPYKLNITVILLKLHDPMPKDSSRPYGYVEIDKNNQIIQGTLILNPYQVLVDQLWLHEGVEVQSDNIEFSPQEFNYWKKKFRESLGNNKIDISEIPPHVYWLFNISNRQTSRVFAYAEWRKIMAHSVEAYVDITKLIIQSDIGKINKLGTPIIQKLDNPALYEKYKYHNRRTEWRK